MESNEPKAVKPRKKKSRVEEKVENTKSITVVGYVVVVVVALFFYISNTLTVRDLLSSNGKMKDDLARERTVTDKIQSQVNQLESVQRIQDIAVKELGLALPQKPPLVIQVRQSELNKLTEKP
ncbi:MAG: hypothetical protein LCH54_01345 [Bacteroidetes bacterium]|nr:hypothetical protein [Bacteroidota bacterium]